jgi:hypothetical protein
MSKRIALRLLAVALVLSVGLFAMQAAGHWHGHSSDEQHCQVCHTGHVAVPTPAAQVDLPLPKIKSSASTLFAVIESPARLLFNSSFQKS